MSLYLHAKTTQGAQNREGKLLKIVKGKENEANTDQDEKEGTRNELTKTMQDKNKLHYGYTLYVQSWYCLHILTASNSNYLTAYG